ITPRSVSDRSRACAVDGAMPSRAASSAFVILPFADTRSTIRESTASSAGARRAFGVISPEESSIQMILLDTLLTSKVLRSMCTRARFLRMLCDGKIADRTTKSPPRGSMRIAVLTEVKNNENRVALTPAGADRLVQEGHRVLVQSGAGRGSGIADDAY